MRVYLSSTWNDLGPEREAVWKALSGHCTVVESYTADEAQCPRELPCGRGRVRSLYRNYRPSLRIYRFLAILFNYRA